MKASSLPVEHQTCLLFCLGQLQICPKLWTRRCWWWWDWRRLWWRCRWRWHSQWAGAVYRSGWRGLCKQKDFPLLQWEVILKSDSLLFARGCSIPITVSGPLNPVSFFYIMLVLTRLKPHSLKSHLCILHYYLLPSGTLLALISFYLKSRLTWQHISSGIQTPHECVSCQ